MLTAWGPGINTHCVLRYDSTPWDQAAQQSWASSSRLCCTGAKLDWSQPTLPNYLSLSRDSCEEGYFVPKFWYLLNWRVPLAIQFY